MAIIEDIPGIKVVVCIRGWECNEYEDPDVAENHPDYPPSSSKFIESVDDTELSIYIDVNADYEWGYKDHILAFDIYVDGNFISGKLIRSSDLKNGKCDREVLGRYQRDMFGSWHVRKLRFSAVRTVDDTTKERISRDSKIAKTLGVVEVRVCRCMLNGPSNHRREPVHSKSFELAEKSLKGRAVSHGTLFAAGERCGKRNIYDTTDLSEDNGPIGVFRFHYRSRRALQQMLIIPNSPPRSPTLAALSEAERDRLAKERLDQIHEQKIKDEKPPIIKREFSEIYDLTLDDMPTRPSKTLRLPSGRQAEVVDLTDD
ncbi:hypothetical protein F4779DRAFT_552811 [Xylariaceae sp. FL0662B]|nr:hypothetical protein F4779DRAFT_552811 [Xylariaceae sp. FL0662B]